MAVLQHSGAARGCGCGRPANAASAPSAPPPLESSSSSRRAAAQRGAGLRTQAAASSMMEQLTARRATMRRQQQQQQGAMTTTATATATIGGGGVGGGAASASPAAAPAQRRCRRRRPSTAVAVLAPAATPKAKAAGVQQLKSTALITAVKTPYLPNGKFDLVAYDALLEQQIAHGVGGVIVGGTTGEGQLMSWDEHIMLIAHTVVCFGDKLQVIGNTGSNSTGEALHATEQGFAVGMNAALQINPYYGRTSASGLRAHFDAVLAEGPGIVYNVPGRTGQDIPDAVVMGLAERHPSNFLGVKECAGNARIGAYAARGVASWSGNDDEAHDARHHHQGAGVISVTSNLVPGLFSRMMHGGKPEPELAASLEPLMAWLFCEPNPIALNTALAMCGLARPVFRLPYVPLSRAQREEGAVLLRAVQEHIPGCKEVRVMEDDEFKLIGRY